MDEGGGSSRQASGGSPRTMLDARVLSAAAEVFSANGYLGASLQDIADRAELSKQLLIYHYGRKPGLWLAALRWSRTTYSQRYWEALGGVSDQVPPLQDAIRATIAAYLAESRWHFMILASGQLPAAHREAARSEVTVTDYQFVDTQLHVWIARGEVQPLPTNVFMHVVFGSLHSMPAYDRLFRGAVTDEDSLERLVEAGQVILELVRPR